MADSKELIHFRDTVLNTKSPSFCGAKWGNSTLWLNSGETASCHLPPVHKIDVVQIPFNIIDRRILNLKFTLRTSKNVMDSRS